jgi:acetylornithine deacetylase/succinyl-diaminopimelate desuccinylase-like protein
LNLRPFVSSSLAVVSLAACGGGTPPPAASAPKVAEVAGPSAAPPTAATQTPPVAAKPALPFEDEARALLLEMTAVDTSHGQETALLRPVLERLRAAGVAGQILESAPGRGNLVARIKGSGAKKPLLLLAHVDVVPVEGQPWTVKPFEPVEKDGFLFGRGINDDKTMAAIFTAAMLDLARQKTALSRDVILALTAGEETGGFAGIKWLVEQHRDLLDAEIALNEGGPLVTTADFADVKLVGIGGAEKTYQSYHLIARGGGGHSSIPSPKPGEDPALELARAVVKVGEFRFPGRVLPAVKEWFAAAASWESGPLEAALKHAAATAPTLTPADDKVLSAERSFNAQVRTTCVTTMLKGAPADNVLPTTAEAEVNCRILPDETREQTLATLTKVIGNPKIEIKPEDDHGVGPASAIAGEVPAIIRRVAQEAFPKAKVVSNMSTGATDSRHLRGLGIACYGLGGAPTSAEESRAGHTAHGPDERRPVKWLGAGARFLRDVVLAVAK